MVEEEISERLRRLSLVVQEAKQRGFPRRDRREAVIIEVAQPALDKENVEVRERAINKYWQVESGSIEIPVLIVAPHALRVGEGEIVGILHEEFSDWSVGKLLKLVNQWIESPTDKKPHKILSEKHPNYRIFKAISRLRGRVDQYTDVLAQSAADKSEAAVMVPKRSRMWADANRRSFFHKPRGVGKGKEFIQTREYPTSARAAWYWALQREVEQKVGLDDEGKAANPFLQLVIHGMGDRRDKDGGFAYDIVIGGGDSRKGEEGRLADEEVLMWFTEGLARKINKQGAQWGNLSVAIDRMGRQEVEVFQANTIGEVERKEIKRVGKGVSGAGLGLEYFRSGHDFRVETMDGKERVLRFPGFGDNFHTLQVEVSKRVRYNSQFRRVLGEIFGEIVVEFQREFSYKR